MKKIILMLVVIIGLNSCGGSEDTQLDLILGKWGKLSIIENGVLTNLDPNVINNQIVLNQDGTLVFLGSNGSSGTWVNQGKGNYKIENIQNGITFSVIYKVEFTSATQMKWSNATSAQTLFWSKLN